MTNQEAREWIMDTYLWTRHLVHKEGIPCDVGVLRNEESFGFFMTLQLKFPWCDGDVVIGTLHAFDDDAIAGRFHAEYPSIETWRFPWDEGDITLFETPEEFVEKLKAYYNEKVREQN